MGKPHLQPTDGLTCRLSHRWATILSRIPAKIQFNLCRKVEISKLINMRLLPTTTFYRNLRDSDANCLIAFTQKKSYLAFNMSAY